MKVIKERMLHTDDEDAVVFESDYIVLELADGSRIQLSQRNTNGVNAMEIMTSYSPDRKMGDCYGLAVVPYSCNVIHVYTCPLGEPETRKKK